MRSIKWLVSALAFGWALAGAALALEQRVHSRVLFVPDPGARTTSFHMIIQAGRADEGPDLPSGIAHYLEHLILVGRNAEHGDAAVRMFPGSFANGTTNFRTTTYLHTVPAERTRPADALDQLFGFYAARLKGFEIPQAEAERERNVVLQEFNQRDPRQIGIRFNMDRARDLMPGYVGNELVGGNEASIKSFTVEQARTFHQRWYGLGNAWFVVRGDLTAEAMTAIAEKHLIGLEVKSYPPRTWRAAPPLEIGRVHHAETSRTATRTQATFTKLVRVPQAPDSPARFARAVLADFMSSKFSGSPHDALVERDALTSNVFASVFTLLPGLYEVRFSATPDPGVEPDALLKAMEAYWLEFAREGVKPEIIERLKTRILVNFSNSMKEPSRVYGMLTQWLSSHTRYDEVALYPYNIRQVDQKAVNDLVKALMRPGRVVTSVLSPEGAPTEAAGAGETGAKP